MNNLNHQNEQPFPKPTEAIAVVFFTYIFTIGISLLHSLFSEMPGQLPESKAFQFMEIVVFIPFFIYLFIRKFPLTTTLRLRLVPLNVVAYSVVVGVSITFLIAELDYLIGLIFPLPEELLQSIEQLMTANSFSELVIIFTSAVLFAGIFEEMLFRGFFQQAFENSKMDLTTAIFFTSLIFALFHIPWWYVQTTIFGIIIGVMAWKSESILPGVIVHAINNAINIFLINVDEKHYQWLEWKGHISPPILAVAALGIYWGIQKLYQHYEQPPAPVEGDESFYK